MTKNFDERIIAEGFHTGYEVDYVTIPEHDYEYLKEQDERVQELETQVENWQKGRYLAVSTIDKERELKKRVQELERDNEELYKLNQRIGKEAWKVEQQNKRYREAMIEARDVSSCCGATAGSILDEALEDWK